MKALSLRLLSKSALWEALHFFQTNIYRILRLPDFSNGAAQQSLAADGATACFSSSLVPSARMLIARRS
jgi:hypothetical protein